MACARTASALLNRYDNLLITRSMSKAFGLAGLRCGYTLSSEAIAERQDWAAAQGRRLSPEELAAPDLGSLLDALCGLERTVRQAPQAQDRLAVHHPI